MDTVIVYNVWVLGRTIEDENQHFPVVALNTSDNWLINFEKASNEFLGCNIEKETNHKKYFRDYVKTLYSITINVKKFKDMYNLDFNINCDECQEMIPYYIDYEFTTVAEQIEPI